MGVPPVHVRRDVNKLRVGDKTLEWYAKAIAEMQKRPIKDPTSWRYQAAIHGYLRSMDPLAKPSDVLPSAANQTKFWNQCQHSSWFFVSWHRGYLLYFEKICRAEIVKLGGPSTWALPYWNYSDSINSRLLPKAFRAATVGSQPNPLFVPGRNVNAAGSVGLDAADVSLQCLTRTKFVGTSSGGSPGFGGPQTGFNHGGGPTGALERTPHGDIHVAVGGLMGAFETAGLDPIFWLHHCNIDRLWEVWRIRPASQGDPTAAAWGNTQFAIHDETGALVSFKSSGMVNTNALGYRYDAITSAASPALRGLAAIQEVPMAKPTGPAPPATLAGATDTSVPLGQTSSSARVALAPPPARSSSRGFAASAPRRVFLNIENITGRGPPGSYSVYVNAPAGEDPAGHPESFAGTLPLFGLEAATRADGGHGGSGLTHVLEITDLVEGLTRAGRWTEGDLHVSFEPKRPVPEGADVKIGRVSVYYG